MLGAFAFLNPWLLAALATLPIIYWLLRAVPPSPARVEFPPTRILVGLENQEKTAEKTRGRNQTTHRENTKTLTVQVFTRTTAG